MAAKKRTGTAREKQGVNGGVKTRKRPAPTKATPARAVQKPEHTAATEARIEHIANLMRSLDFITGETVRELAAQWGLGEQRIRELSSIASKRVRKELTDPDRVVVKVATALEKVIDDAIRETDEPALIEKQGNDGPVTYQESPNGARRVLIEAAKTLCVLTGANAPTKVEVSEKPMSRTDLIKALRDELAILESMPEEG